MFTLFTERLKKKIPPPPTPPSPPPPAITEPVVDSAVKAHLLAPVAVVKNKSIATPTPISWSPEEAHFRRRHPCARHPVVVARVVIVGPVARRPEITITRTKRLLIGGQRGRPDGDGHTNLGKRRC